MTSVADSIEKAKSLVMKCLTTLYEQDSYLFERNSGEGVCERCLVFRFAYHLQNDIEDYYVDCDYNSSSGSTTNADGEVLNTERIGKVIRNEGGTNTRRFVDIIVHERNYNAHNDYICFEVKKWNSREDTKEDLNKLKRLTSDYNYLFGFHLILGRTLKETQWRIFRGGIEVEPISAVFGDV